MPQITKVENAGQRRVILYDENCTLAVVEEELWQTVHFREGDTITEEELAELQLQSDFCLARRKALDYLARRAYSAKELAQKLRLSSGEQAAQAAVQRMQELGLIDDEKFARMYAGRLWETKHMAPKAIAMELRRKGIERPLAELAAAELLEENPRERISALLQGKYANALETEKGIRRAVNGMLRLGYEYDDIKAVLREIKETNDCEELQEE